MPRPRWLLLTTALTTALLLLLTACGARSAEADEIVELGTVLHLDSLDAIEGGSHAVAVDADGIERRHSGDRVRGADPRGALVAFSWTAVGDPADIAIVVDGDREVIATIEDGQVRS